MLTKLPEGTEVYVFGSFINTASPNDLDILFLYDPSKCLPQNAYKEHLSFIEYLEVCSELKVDATLLTYEEQLESNFLAISKAIPVNECEELTKRFTRINYSLRSKFAAERGVSLTTIITIF
ncbi:hypothetical protein [Marinomonas foliarum]|nr:hypothetical protein [Marinomonas foliarum]